MRIPFLALFVTSPFVGLREHADKVKECSLVFQKAMECYLSDECKRFEELRQHVIQLEQEADAIKRRIRGHIPKGAFMAVEKFQLFRYLTQQDKVLDTMEDAMDLISFRPEPGVPDQVHKEFLELIDKVIDSVDEMPRLLEESISYFKTFSEKQRVLVKDIIHGLRQKEHIADISEKKVKRIAYNLEIEPVRIFHLIQLAEIIGAIADHVENAGDMMRAMLAR